MESTAHRAVAIVGVGAILPDAPNVSAFWDNIKKGRYSVTDVQPDRWDPNLYYDPDPKAPDKTYSKIGGWVREYSWDPMKWHLAIPPRVADAMDGGQKWGVACTREALEDYGYPKRPLDPDRTAVILGNAMAGEKHYLTALRIYFPECARDLESAEHFAALPQDVRHEILRELHDRMAKHLPEVTEDTMPGELSNCIAGRIANIFNFHGPNYICDAACASAMAAISSALEGLIEHHFDAVITGGIDRNMGAPSYVKFCKIGALSATGTRPYAQGADGFVMGEGAALFLMKRLADAERDGDQIYAVIRGMGGSSDGKGKGITAPNPAGQRLAVQRAWEIAGLSPATATYIEGHGTSTRVGDVVEVQSMADVLKQSNIPTHSVAIGSVKSNFGHLKSAAGAAGLLKATLALHEKVLPPSVHCERPNPDIDFAHSPLFVNTELREWTAPADGVRRAGLSAFGFGGTNFHAVLEEYIPHRLNGNGKRSIAVGEIPSGTSETSMNAHGSSSSSSSSPYSSAQSCKAPLRGALVIGANSAAELVERLRVVEEEAAGGRAPVPSAPAARDLQVPERIAIDYVDAPDLREKSANALKAFKMNQPAMWKALRAQGIFRGHGPAPKVAFLYPGQGSQYVNMLKPLRALEPIVADTFAEADRVMKPLLGKPLSEFIFVDKADPEAVAKAEDDLRQTAITQPAVLATDLALTRMLAAYGITPDFAMGHSLGEYGALVAAGGLPFADALEAVSARGREMTQVAMKDNGRMAAVFAPLPEIERILQTVTGYVVIANINSEHQAVIGGASDAVQLAMGAFQKAGFEVAALSVSHAFHTSIVAPTSEPLRRVLQRLHLAAPKLPIVANVDGEFYPTGENVVPKMLDLLAQQVAAPVQFVKGLRTLYNAGARVFVEVGPKKALQGFAEDVLGPLGDVISLFTNHPKNGDIPSFNQALCCLYAAGLGKGVADVESAPVKVDKSKPETKSQPTTPASLPVPTSSIPVNGNGSRYVELGRMFAEVLDRGWELYHGEKRAPVTHPVAITGAALGLPGTDHIFDDTNIGRLLHGDQLIDVIPLRFRQATLDKHITRLVKSDNGGAFETITDVADVIKLAGRGGTFDLEAEFGVSPERIAALDRVTQLALAVGIDTLRDAGIPLVMRYKTTSKGTQLPDRWGLPESMRDDTGVIFASAFPGLNSFADEITRHAADQARREQMRELQNLRARLAESNGDSIITQELDRRIEELCDMIEHNPYVFDRRFLFRVLCMGHSQLAEFIGARGPNTSINAACASTTQAVALAEDWIRAGRCRRVLVVAADDVTSDKVIDWFCAGFLASGAAATDDEVEKAAVPFDRRRHGMIIGMGAAGLMVESAESAAERGLSPICEVLSTVTANSAFHGTRLDVNHISQVMEDLVRKAETSSGIKRHEIAPQTVFVSHETYTPARGGSAAAEIHALRQVFGNSADHVVIANTKGFTGHAMGAGIEDVLAVKALETGVVPPVANFKEVDPELGALNLSNGGIYPVNYALRLGAGFGSQISLTLCRWVPTPDGTRPSASALGYSYRVADKPKWDAWLAGIAGRPNAELEIAHRTLRVRDQAAGARSVETKIVAISESTPARPVAVAEQKAVAKPLAAIVPPPLAPAGSITVATPKPTVDLPTPALKTTAIPSAAEKAPAVETAPVQSAAGDPVKERILALVVEKTGYPADMLDLDLDLEADLGVDTVKQAEMFAAIREIYNIPRDENRKLRDYPTLAHVIRFVYEKRPDLKDTAIPAAVNRPEEIKPTPPASVTPVPSVVNVSEPIGPSRTAAQTEPRGDDSVRERILALVVEKTGYPQDMLDLDLDLEADLGVDTVKQAEMFAAIREIYNIPRDENRKLRDYPTLAHVIRFVYEQRPDLKAAATAAIVNPPEKIRVTEPVSITSVPPEVTASESVRPSHTAPQTELSGDDLVEERILALVVDKTGYPKEMLDLDLDLEADLGVDTVKQAEMFAAIREIYNIPRDENRKLRDYPTLAHVIRFVYEQRPDLAAHATAKTASPEEKKLETVAEAASVSAVEPATANLPEPVTALQSASSVSTSSRADAVKEKVLEIVAEKTGYPKEMLDLDLDLEADLGIDTVKQAEMFASIRAAYNIPRDENLKLRDFPTLAHVIKFAQDRSGLVSSAPVPKAEIKQSADSASLPVTRPTLGFEAANAIPRRVPVPVLRPPLNLCKPSTATLERGDRVVIMPDQGGVADALTKLLDSKGVNVLRIDRTASAEAIQSTLKNWISAGPVHGVYWLPALDDEGDLRAMTPKVWHESVRIRIKSFYTAMRALYEQIAPRGTFLVTATRLGGQHGYDDAGAIDPLGGAVVGFAKTYKRERPESHVKALDFAPEHTASEIAVLLIEETLHDPGAIETGYKNGLRWTVGLEELPASDGQPGLILNRDTVFVVTGAAGSIVSAITADLAAASGGTFYLLDLVPQPDANNPDLKRFVSDRDGLKRELFTRIQSRGERATPALVERELAALERAHAAQSAIDAVRSAGGTAHYFSVNLTDAEAVANVIAQIRKEHGRIDVLLHGAGLDRSRSLAEKEPREFDLVFDVKCDGFFNLLHAIGDMPLAATVAFSSIAGRFGNPGQTDYSSANDLLCKITSSLRTTHPATRGIAIDWTAWGGIGMATRGSIPKVMEMAGIDMLPPEAGVPLIRRELTVGSTRGEIVIGQSLGVLLKEWDETAGIDPATTSVQGPMLGKIVSAGLYQPLRIETNLDPKVQPFLYDHQIEGTPVLPGVMGIEAFAEAALALVPGWHVEGIEDVNFLAPFKFYRNDPRAVIVEAMIRPKNDHLIATCSLVGLRSLPNQTEPQRTLHFSARVLLSKDPIKAPAGPPLRADGSVIDAADIYRLYFHGPAYQVIQKAWWDGSRIVGLRAGNLPGNHHPLELTTVAAPRLIELCFQTAGIWEMGLESRMGLPLHIDRLTLSSNISESIAHQLYAVVTRNPAHSGFDAEILDASGTRYLQLTGYRTVQLPDTIDAEKLKALQAAMAPDLVAA
jgi:acyl transferase domain-containing protein/NAD(P)-dependent dehydrogenase (short-subunit alcohol dehydrogenase family)